MCILRIAETRYDWMEAFGNKNDAKAITAGEGNRELQQKATNWQGQLSRAGSSNSKEFFSLFDSPTCHWRSFNCLRVLESSRVFPLPKALTQFRMNPPSHKPCLQEVTAKMKTGSAVRSTSTDMSWVLRKRAQEIQESKKVRAQAKANHSQDASSIWPCAQHWKQPGDSQLSPTAWKNENHLLST